MALKEQMERQGNWLFRFRGILPLLILGWGVYECLQTELHPGLPPQVEASFEYLYEMICLAVSLLGLGIRIHTIGHTPRNTSGRNVGGQLADELNTTGIYSVVRHPLYLGNFFMWLGIAMLPRDVAFLALFVLIYWLYYERIIFAEEQFLARKFGAPYAEWAARTPCIIPDFRRYVRPALSFSWKKVLKKEKNGLLALLLIFGMLDIAGETVAGKEPKYLWLHILTAIVAASYLVIRHIKKHTTLLDEPGR